MRPSLVVIGTATAATTALLSWGISPLAHASDGDWGLNGLYTATSNGEWARTNDRYQDEDSIRSTWTIVTTCSYPTECTGTVTSDQGWSTPIYKKSGLWYVKRQVPNWEPCPNGTAAGGLQVFRFWPATADGSIDPGSSTLIGEDETNGASGACGINKPLVIKMPFKLVKVN